MLRTRLFALCLGIGCVTTSATGKPPGPTFAEVSTIAKEAYDAGRHELSIRGVKARDAAAAGEVAKWMPLNDGYAKQLAEIVGVCGRNVAALTRDASDLAATDAKQISRSFTQYAEIAGSMETQRLELIAFGNLVERIPTMDRASLLKALAAKYFVEK
jgi:hypothetical protein